MTRVTRETAETLLPFLANETLQADERRAVEAWVLRDAELAQDLAALREIRQHMRSDFPAASPGEFGLARLMRDIKADAKPQPRQTGMWKVAAVVTMALLAGQTVWTTGAFGPGADYTLASGDAALDGPLLHVTFIETATEGAIRQILLGAQLELVEGPSALGVYTLRYGDENPIGTVAEQLERADVIATITWEGR